MGMDGGINIITLKHPVSYLTDLLGPFHTTRMFIVGQTGSRDGDNSRREFIQNYKVPEDVNIIFDVVGDDINEDSNYSAIPRMLNDFVLLIDLIEEYFPQDKDLLQNITWGEFISNLEFFVPTWDTANGKNSGLYSYWLNKTVWTHPFIGMSFLEVCKVYMQNKEHSRFFDTGFMDWIKAVVAEFLSINYYQTWT